MSSRPVTRRSATGTRRQSGASSPCQSRRPASGAAMSGRGRPLAEKCRGRRTSRPACSAPRACRVDGGSSRRVSRCPLPLLPPSVPVRARSRGGRELCGTSRRRTSSRKVPAGAAGLPCRRLWKARAAEGRPGTTVRHGARSMLSSVRRTSMPTGFRAAEARTRPAGAMRASRPRRERPSLSSTRAVPACRRRPTPCLRCRSHTGMSSLSPCQRRRTLARTSPAQASSASSGVASSPFRPTSTPSRRKPATWSCRTSRRCSSRPWPKISSMRRCWRSSRSSSRSPLLSCRRTRSTPASRLNHCRQSRPPRTAGSTGPVPADGGTSPGASCAGGIPPARRLRRAGLSLFSRRRPGDQ